MKALAHGTPVVALQRMAPVSTKVQRVPFTAEPFCGGPVRPNRRPQPQAIAPAMAFGFGRHLGRTLLAAIPVPFMKYPGWVLPAGQKIGRGPMGRPAKDSGSGLPEIRGPERGVSGWGNEDFGYWQGR